MSYSSEKLQACANQIMAAGRELHAQGWTPATSSNFSMRLDSQHCAITVSGKHKGKLQTQDVMVVDLEGQSLDQRKPSAETALHTQLYQWDASIEAVLHTHSPAVTVLSMQCSDPTLIFQGYELQKAFPGVTSHEEQVVIPVFDNTQDIPKLAKQVQHYLKSHPQTPAYLIRGHGAYTWGASIGDCERHLEALEFLVRCELQVRALGTNQHQHQQK